MSQFYAEQKKIVIFWHLCQNLKFCKHILETVYESKRNANRSTCQNISQISRLVFSVFSIFGYSLTSDTLYIFIVFIRVRGKFSDFAHSAFILRIFPIFGYECDLWKCILIASPKPHLSWTNESLDVFFVASGSKNKKIIPKLHFLCVVFLTILNK